MLDVLKDGWVGCMHYWRRRMPWSRFGHSVRRPGQFVCPNKDSVCPNTDKIYLTVVTSKFLRYFLLIKE
jgi:hypothetical protein